MDYNTKGNFKNLPQITWLSAAKVKMNYKRILFILPLVLMSMVSFPSCGETRNDLISRDYLYNNYELLVAWLDGDTREDLAKRDV